MEVKHSTKACAEKTGRRGPEKLVISYRKEPILAFIGIVTKNGGTGHLEPAYQVVWFRIQPRGNNISTTKSII